MPRERQITSVIERNFKLRILQIGITQAQVADAFDWSRQRLYYMLTQPNPSLRTLRQLARASALDISTLIEGDEADVIATPKPDDVGDWLDNLGGPPTGIAKLAQLV